MNSVTRSTRYWLAPLGLAFFFSACSETPEVHFSKGDVGELQFQVAYVPISPNQTEVRMRERVRGLVEHLEHQLSTAYEGSEVVRINQWHSTEVMVLTRELEDFVRAGLEANELTEGGLPLFSWPAGASTRAAGEPLLQVENHQLVKRAPGVQITFDSLLSGFVVDRIVILMGQMGIEHYQVTVNGQRRARGHHRLTMLGSEATGSKPRNFALGYSVAADGSGFYVIGKTTLQASAIAQWLATMTRSEALITAERLNLAVSIHVHENGTLKRYTSRAFQ